MTTPLDIPDKAIIMPDDTERQYLRAISAAVANGDNDSANYYATGLVEYRRFYKIGDEHA